MQVKSNTASGMPVCLRRNGIGSRSSGKERDAETGLDYFGARYYSGAQGRFVSADPLFIEMRRLGDPQQLNLYAYARNNPLRFIDPNGLFIKMNCETEQDCLDAVNMINGRNNAQFWVTLNNGFLDIVPGSVDDNLSRAEQALYDAITGPGLAIINVVKNTGKADYGTRLANGKNQIDLENLSKLYDSSNDGGLWPGDIVSHEALEAYLNLFAPFMGNYHYLVSKYFPGLGRRLNDDYGLDITGQFLIGGRYQQKISDGRGIMETTTVITPIPKQSLIGKTQAEKIQIIDAATTRVKDVRFIPKP
jgi:RHS repeat-associated protein